VFDDQLQSVGCHFVGDLKRMNRSATQSQEPSKVFVCPENQGNSGSEEQYLLSACQSLCVVDENRIAGRYRSPFAFRDVDISTVRIVGFQRQQVRCLSVAFLSDELQNCIRLFQQSCKRDHVDVGQVRPFDCVQFRERIAAKIQMGEVQAR